MTINSSFDAYLIRHGKTDWNAEGRVQGHTDIPLNQDGLSQASVLRDRLSHVEFSAAYSSDLSRAKRTSEIVVASRGVEVVPTVALRERSMGPWEGLSVAKYQELADHNELAMTHLSKDEYMDCSAQGSVESYAEVFKRLYDFLISLEKVHAGRSVLISSHAGVLSAVLYHLDFRPGLHWRISNCGHLKLRIHADGKISLLDSAGLSLKVSFCFCQANRSSSWQKEGFNK